MYTEDRGTHNGTEEGHTTPGTEIEQEASTEQQAETVVEVEPEAEPIPQDLLDEDRASGEGMSAKEAE